MPGRSTAKQGRESIGLRIVTSPWTAFPSAARARTTGAGRSVAVEVLLAIVVEVLLATAVRILLAVAVGGCLLGARGVRCQKFLDARLDLGAGLAIELALRIRHSNKKLLRRFQ